MAIVNCRFFFGAQRNRTYSLADLEGRANLVQYGQYGQGGLLFHFRLNLDSPLGPIPALGQGIKICQSEFNIYCFNIRFGINLVTHMKNVRIVKAAHHMGNYADFPYMGKELISQTFAF
jgi:hypothetical protein